MAKMTCYSGIHQLVFLYSAFLLLLVPPDVVQVSSFVCVFPARKHRPVTRKKFQNFLQYGNQDERLERNDGDDNNWNGNESNGLDTFHVITSDKVILPGEQTSLSFRDEDAVPLIQYAVKEDNEQPRVRVAMAVRVATRDEYGWNEMSLAQVASLCEIDVNDIKVADEDNEVTVYLRCVGRIRLSDMVRQYNTQLFQGIGEWIEEGFPTPQELEKARSIEGNIEKLMKKASCLEEEIRAEREESRDGTQSLNLYESYSKTKARIFRMVSTAYDQRAQHVLSGNKDHNIVLSDNHDYDTMSLTATSWAVFLCLDDANLEARYRLRALDWDNLLERIKLAQYVLREKHLFLQGQLLEIQDENASFPSPLSLQEDFFTCDEDAFQ